MVRKLFVEMTEAEYLEYYNLKHSASAPDSKELAVKLLEQIKADGGQVNINTQDVSFSFDKQTSASAFIKKDNLKIVLSIETIPGG